MATLQVKGIDDNLYRALAARAAQDNRSISQEVVTLIQAFLARLSANPSDATEAFLEMSGTWKDERPAKTIAAEIRRSRRSGRRLRTTRVFD
ncbi:MAG: antitoxin [Candidatus Hydrogenedentes bacterium]|nr:antitoxin [Candidatus Hydrogenedentota bacterium]